MTKAQNLNANVKKKWKLEKQLALRIFVVLLEQDWNDTPSNPLEIGNIYE